MGALLPAEYLYVTIAVIIALVFYIVNNRMNLQNYNPEGPLFIKARKEGIPLLDIVDPGTNQARFVLGEKEREDDPVYAKDAYGLHADPSYVEGDSSPEQHPNGLMIQHVSPNVTFPVSPKCVLAQKTILAHRKDRKQFKDLDFLSDRDLLVLLNSPMDHLAADARIFIESYQPMVVGLDEEGRPVEVAMEANDLVERIKEFKDYITTIPIETGKYAYNEYFRNNPYGHSSQTTQRINYLFQRIADRKAALNDKLWTYALIAIALIGISAVAVYIVSIAVK